MKHTSSAPAVLTVELPSSPVIVLEPQSSTATAGDPICLMVVAVGTPPLTYQWFKDGSSLPGETNEHLFFPSFDQTNVGSYSVVVSNFAENVTSLPARLTLQPGQGGGGTVYLSNRGVWGGTTLNALVYDVDGVTPLAGPGFSAQLYVGTTPDSLHPAGQPQPFLTGFQNGIITPAWVTLPHIAQNTPAYAQVRVWESARGASFEEVHAVGGKLGQSDVLPVITSGPNVVQPGLGLLVGLKSFSLQDGLPEYRRGRLTLISKTSAGTVTWALLGEPGARYLIERQQDGASWIPLLTLDNATGRVIFSDTPPASSHALLYRAELVQ